MKTLVTGATGYIGTHLVEMALEDGHQLILASRRPAKIREAEWIAYDLKSESPLHLSEPVDAIIHMAANTSGLER